MPKRNSQLILIFTFFSVVLPPLGNDIFFASLPTMGRDLATAHVHWVVSVYLLGFALAQLAYGPLSERFGRRPLLLTALSLVLLGCSVVSVSGSFTVVLAARFVQATGACGVLCLVLAIIRDSYPPKQIVRVTGVLFGILGFVPAFAPLLGALMVTVVNWRSEFTFLVLLALCCALITAVFFKESLAQKNHHALNVQTMVRSYRQLWLMKPYRYFCLVSCFSYASFFTFLCASPYLFIEPFKLTLVQYGALVAVNGLGIVLSGFVVPMVSRRFSVIDLALGGSVLLVVGALALGLMHLGAPAKALWPIVLPAFVVNMGVGLIRPTASAGAITSAPKSLAGPASALFSFTAFIGGAALSLLSQYAGARVTHLALLLLVTGTATCFFAVKGWVHRHHSLKASQN